MTKYTDVAGFKKPVTAALDIDLADWVKAYAAKENISLSQVLADATACYRDLIIESEQTVISSHNIRHVRS